MINAGDYKMDPTPPDNKPFDLHVCAIRTGRRLALFGIDSTSIASGPASPSDRAVIASRRIIPRSAPRSFAPATGVIHSSDSGAVDIATATGRKIAFVGRSMVDNVEIAHGLNLLRIPDSLVVRAQEYSLVRSEKIGEDCSSAAARPNRCLPCRIAVDNHHYGSVEENDTVILSAQVPTLTTARFSVCWIHVPPARARLLR